MLGGRDAKVKMEGWRKRRTWSSHACLRPCVAPSRYGPRILVTIAAQPTEQREPHVVLETYLD